MARKSYSDKLKDPRWQKKRLEIMERDSFSCQNCEETKKTLSVHHRWYENGKNPWEYEDSCYITLCEKCHKIYKNINQELIQKLHKKFSLSDLAMFDLWLGKPYDSAYSHIAERHDGLFSYMDLFTSLIEYPAYAVLCSSMFSSLNKARRVDFVNPYIRKLNEKPNN